MTHPPELYASYPTWGRAIAYRRRWIKAHPGQPKPRIRRRATYRLDLWRVYAGTGDIPGREYNLGTGQRNWWLP